MSTAKKIGTSESRSAIPFFEELRNMAQKLKIDKLTKTDYEPDEDIADLKSQYKDQDERIKDYRDHCETRQELIDRQANGEQAPATLKRIEGVIANMAWRGLEKEESIRNTRHTRWKAAAKEIEDQAAGVATFYERIQERVVDSILLKISDETKNIEEPHKKVQKMMSILKEEVIGDQPRERHHLMQDLESITPAKSDEALKEKLNTMREIKRMHKASGQLEDKITEIDDETMIRVLGQVAMDNAISFPVKSTYDRLKNARGGKFDKIANEMEKALDAAIKASGRAEHMGRGMGISNASATANQTIGMAAHSNYPRGGKSSGNDRDGRYGSRLQCFRWAEWKQCKYGDNCNYVHDDDDTRGTTSQRNGSTQGRSPSRDKSPNRGGGYGYNNRKEPQYRSNNNSRDRSRSRDRDSSRRHNRDRDREKSPDKNSRDIRQSRQEHRRSPSPQNLRRRHENREQHHRTNYYSSDDENSSGASTGKGNGGTPYKKSSR